MPQVTLEADPIDLLAAVGAAANDPVSIQNRSTTRDVRIWWAEPADPADDCDYILFPQGEISVEGEATVFAWSHTEGVRLSVNAVSAA